MGEHSVSVSSTSVNTCLSTYTKHRNTQPVCTCTRWWLKCLNSGIVNLP